MDEYTVNFFDRIKYGRVFLFLGFDYFTNVFGYNPVARILSNSNDDNFSFSELFLESKKIDLKNNFIQLQKDINSLPTNNTLDPISNIKWNAVYTSSIDDLILTRLKGEGRVTIPVCKNDKKNPFSRTDLCVHYLFGLYSRIDVSERVPQDRREFIKRSNEAQMMLNHLVDSMNPLDTLVISGWQGTRDPLKSEVLYQTLSKLSLSQSYIFGYNDDLEDELITDLISQGILISNQEALPAFITKHADGLEGIFDNNIDLESFVRVNDKAIELPSRIRRLVKNCGQIVEDKFFVETKEKNEEVFRDFLFESSRTPVWKAYVKDLDFERDYYKPLYNLVTEEIKKNKVHDSPIILHGSTGTGKSISIARLCSDLYRDEKYLILHINNQRESLDFKMIDEVCEWAESTENLTTVICWDGMTEIDSYQNLSSYLSSRGRKQVVVGTTYKIQGKRNKYYLESHDQFSVKENERFISYLDLHNIEIESESKKFDSAFLVALYRLLPETRFAITSGVVKEANNIKSRLYSKIMITDSSESIIAEAFRKVLDEKNIKLSSFIAKDTDSGISDIVDTVMIFGKFGIESPLDVLMRVYPSLKLTNIGSILKDIDIVRWTENPYGEIYLSPRNTLEAEIYCKRIIINNRELIKKLLLVISSVEQKKAFNCPEIKFCTDIIRAFGPNGNDGKDYKEHYLDISRCIGELLSTKRIVSSRLMLLQANLLREYGRVKYDDKNIYYHSYYELLLEALGVIEKAIDIEEKDGRNLKRNSNSSLITLYGEKASILGTLANQIKNKDRKSHLIPDYVSEAIDTLRGSFKYKISNYISLDSIAWIVINYAKGEKDLDAKQLKFLLDAIALFDEYSVDDLEERFQTDFLNRKATLYETIGHEGFSKSTLLKLKELSSEDYHYYNLTKIIGGISFDESNDLNFNKSLLALDYINDNLSEVKLSYKLSVLHLRMFWFYENKSPLLKGERVVIKKTNEFWDEILNICNNILKASDSYNTIRYSLMKAIASFNLGDYKDSDKIFKILARESDSISGSKRIFKSFLMSNESGVRKYSGEIVALHLSRNRGEVYIDELKTKVMFLPSDFNITLEDEGSYLNNFHIAFNFLGPLADNEKYYKANR